VKRITILVLVAAIIGGGFLATKRGKREA